MSQNKEQERSDILIEGNVARWSISLNGAIEGLYTGEFKFRCFLTPSQRLAAGREYRQLLGDNPTLATKHDDDLAFALSQLKYRIISAPPFWTSTTQSGGIPGDIPDEEIIDAILNAAVDSELKYMAQLKKKKMEALDKAKKAAERMLTQQDEEDNGDSESETSSD